jgi:two-component system OmpR family sensor kinase
VFRIGAAREPADTERAMRRIESEAERMGVVVEDLLTLARLDEVRDPVREHVDLAQLARDAAADARAIDPAREITSDVAGPVPVIGDPHQLRQVIGNLMRNALTHTPPGSPVEISAAHAGDKAMLTVRDHGAGLPTDDADAMFERFWRAEEGRVRGRGGAGLGLAIVAGIVAAHPGTVRAENADGGGARFVVELPGSLLAKTQASRGPRSATATKLALTDSPNPIEGASANETEDATGSDGTGGGGRDRGGQRGGGERGVERL